MSSKGWETFSLGSLCKDIFDGPHATPNKTQEGPIFLGISNLANGRIDLTKPEYLSEEDFIKWTRRVTPQPNDLVFSYETRLGEAALIPNGLRCCLGRRMGLLRFDTTKVDPRFMLYAYLGPEFQQTIRERTIHGSTVERIPLIELPDFPISIPPLTTQRRIADILSALDDKIELNRQTNATLEAIAQAVFREWFVNFNFPGATGEMQASELGPIPVGWRIGKVGELCEVNNNSILKNDQFEWIDYIEISQVSKGKIANVTRYLFGEEPSRARRKLKHGDTVLSTVRPNRGSYFLALNPAETSIASTGFAVFSPTKVPFGFLYLLLTDSEKLEYYGHVADGAAYPAINPKLIMEMEIVIPEDCVLNDFHSITEPIFYKMFFADQETETLAQMRDTLLPKLMRGEIEV